MCDNRPTCKQRFKGVENFLRRIAFNLGNSPSQTEIKIISCIPIDVTDLQQKICDLERLLKRTQKPPAVVHTAICETRKPSLNRFNESTDILKEDPSPDPVQSILSYKIETPQENANIETPEPKDQIEPPLTPRSSANSALNVDNKVKSFFRKSKNKKSTKRKHNKNREHMVYYAQTENFPFNYHDVAKPSMKKEKASKVRNDFFVDMIRKQYEPIIYGLSDISSFSSPVCRDVEHKYLTANAQINAHVSDFCSCSGLDFLNIDKESKNGEFGFSPTFSERIQSHDMYYDSSLYDLVPVREAPAKSKKNIPKKQQHKNVLPNFDYAYKPYIPPMYVNYHTVVPTKLKFTHSVPKRTPTRKIRRPPNRRVDVRTMAEITQEDTSNSCRIECGNVYMKPATRKPEPPPTARVETKNYPVTYNNAVKATLQDTECQTTTTLNTENVSVRSDDKTEVTLNQIKSILQSVLTEVKTNAKAKTEPEVKLKKDAVVQKGTSFNNLPGSSRLLSSFTYSPYNVGPYRTSCSHSINPGQYWPGIPYSKCMHNYPVFIQTPGRQGCVNFFKKPSHVAKPAAASLHETRTPNATSASTNTEADPNQNYETETLIKEIYKSIALNVDMPKKEISASNCSSLRRSSRVSTKSGYRSDKSVSVRQDSLPHSLYRRKDAITSGLTPFSSNMFSKVTSNTVSVQSHIVSSTDTNRRLRNDRLDHYLDTTQEMPSEESTERMIKSDHKAPSVRSREVTDSSSEESDEEQNQYDLKTEVQKKERNGLFSKMIHSVKLFKNRRRKSQKSKLESEEEEESDSDDYQTVYSQQAEKARKAPVMQTRRIPHSKVSYSRQARERNQEKLRRSTMEQEYRRKWNEQLMFQPRSPYTSDRTDRSHRSSQRFKKTFEARPVLVEQSIPTQNFMSQDRPLVLERPLVPPKPARPAVYRQQAAKGLAWFRQRCHCGEHFKQLYHDN